MRPRALHQRLTHGIGHPYLGQQLRERLPQRPIQQREDAQQEHLLAQLTVSAVADQLLQDQPPSERGQHQRPATFVGTHAHQHQRQPAAQPLVAHEHHCLLEILHGYRQPETHRINMLQEPESDLRLLADHRLDLAQRRIPVHHRQQPQHAQIVGAAHCRIRGHQRRNLPAAHRIGAHREGLLHQRQAVHTALHHGRVAPRTWPDQSHVRLALLAPPLILDIHHGQPKHRQQLLGQLRGGRSLKHHAHAAIMQQKQHLLMLGILGHRRRHLQPQSRSRLQITQSGIELGLRRRQQQRMRLQRPISGHQPVQVRKPRRLLTQ